MQTHEITASSRTIDGLVVFYKKIPTDWTFIALHAWCIVLWLKESSGAIHACRGLSYWSKFAFGAWNARHGSFKTGGARLTGNAALSIVAALCAFGAWF